MPPDLPELAALPRLAEVIRDHDLAADKRLGQHFLLDPGILSRIAAAAGDLAGRHVLEVGPGPGGLTRALLAAGAKVTAIERDSRCVDALDGLVAAAAGRLTVIEGDALKIPLDEIAAGGRLTIVANLPYNVGTAMLLAWLHALKAPDAPLDAMHLLFQKEVVDRLAAAPRTHAYGRLSVIAQALCRVERAFALPASAFHPPPKVTSALVSLWPRADRPAGGIVDALEIVTRAAFGQRRKMLRSSLKGVPGDAAAMLDGAGIDPSARAETLTIGDFLKLAALLRAPAAD